MLKGGTQCLYTYCLKLLVFPALRWSSSARRARPQPIWRRPPHCSRPPCHRGRGAGGYMGMKRNGARQRVGTRGGRRLAQGGPGAGLPSPGDILPPYSGSAKRGRCRRCLSQARMRAGSLFFQTAPAVQNGRSSCADKVHVSLCRRPHSQPRTANPSSARALSPFSCVWLVPPHRFIPYSILPHRFLHPFFCSEIMKNLGPSLALEIQRLCTRVAFAHLLLHGAWCTSFSHPAALDGILAYQSEP